MSGYDANEGLEKAEAKGPSQPVIKAVPTFILAGSLQVKKIRLSSKVIVLSFFAIESLVLRILYCISVELKQIIST